MARGRTEQSATFYCGDHLVSRKRLLVRVFKAPAKIESLTP
jgi:hypothetical protein